MEALSLFPDKPHSRSRDPYSSHAAAVSVAPSVPELNDEILRALRRIKIGTAFNIAAEVERENPGRWSEGTIRTRVSPLREQGRIIRTDGAGRSPRGQKCDRFQCPSRLVPVENVDTQGRI